MLHHRVNLSLASMQVNTHYWPAPHSVYLFKARTSTRHAPPGGASHLASMATGWLSQTTLPALSTHHHTSPACPLRWRRSMRIGGPNRYFLRRGAQTTTEASWICWPGGDRCRRQHLAPTNTPIAALLARHQLGLVPGHIGGLRLHKGTHIHILSTPTPNTLSGNKSTQLFFCHHHSPSLFIV